jgi:adenine-specific DNA methylase
MGEEFEEVDDTGEDTVLRPGVKKHVCPHCGRVLEYRVEGRFVVRFCPSKDHKKYEEED